MPMMCQAVAPRLNFADVPEVEGKSRLDRCCRLLDLEPMSEAVATQQASGFAPGPSDLAVMFPALEASLVHALAADAATPQQAVETLLLLSCAAADPAGERLASTPTVPRKAAPKDLHIDDHALFPSLTDSDGWQVAALRDFDRNPNEDLGSAWCQRAKVAMECPMPALKPQKHVAPPSRRRPKGKSNVTICAPQEQLETDYDLRQRKGQHHANQRAKYARGGSNGSHNMNSRGTGTNVDEWLAVFSMDESDKEDMA